MGFVWVEMKDGVPVRIFRDRSWANFPPDSVRDMNRAEAVRKIRRQVFQRAGERCEADGCGRYCGWDIGHMHEKKHRSLGGEISLENCEWLCPECHQFGTNARHKDRRWQTSKLRDMG